MIALGLVASILIDASIIPLLVVPATTFPSDPSGTRGAIAIRGVFRPDKGASVASLA